MPAKRNSTPHKAIIKSKYHIAVRNSPECHVSLRPLYITVRKFIRVPYGFGTLHIALRGKKFIIQVLIVLRQF